MKKLVDSNLESIVVIEDMITAIASKNAPVGLEGILDGLMRKYLLVYTPTSDAWKFVTGSGVVWESDTDLKALLTRNLHRQNVVVFLFEDITKLGKWLVDGEK
jgi:hypothetical protein